MTCLMSLNKVPLQGRVLAERLPRAGDLPLHGERGVVPARAPGLHQPRDQPGRPRRPVGTGESFN